ncbi:MAG: chemotaxis protein [Noviherbaspirillum sp.]|jgi:hypothetical protein|nr:chemotaxis protein [Noviherbaspirillum sp.]MDB5794165.1 chemotaxis protein [Noviherbaspirillum sp.]
MPGNRSVSSQVKNLLSHLSDQGTHHLGEVESDLGQTRFLLRQAVEALAANFVALHAAAAAQQETIDELLAGAKPTGALTEKLRNARKEIDLHANAAVTGLQFQDMTNQLIERTADRVAGLRAMLDSLGMSGAGLPQDGREAEMAAALAGIIGAAEEQSSRLNGALRKAVSQTHMESGDVELF